MKTNLKICLLVALAAIFVTWSADQANGQSPWQRRSGQSSVALRYMSPSFKSSDYWKPSATLVDLDITGRLSEKATLIMNIPFAHYRESYEDYYWGTTKSVTQDLLGNPYCGVRVLSPNPSFTYDFGLRLPLTGEDKPFAAIIGAFSDIDQIEAYIHDYLPIHLGLSIDAKNSEGLFGRIKIYPYSWIYIGDNKYADATEFLLHYGAVAGFENKDLRLQGGISGLSILSEENALTDDTSMNQFGMEMSYRLGKFWPGIHFRLPLDEDINDIINLVWGVSVLYESE
jgi:hypothetical protein